MANDRDHFESYREQTRVKHTILEKYLPSFFNILKGNHHNLVYIDGFAGRGTHTDTAGGETCDGSPLRALKKIAASDELRAKVSTFFVERDPKLAAELLTTVSDFWQSNKGMRQPVVRAGEFARELTSTLDELEKQGSGLAPTFLFVDPCGLAGANFQVIQRYLNQPHCEALVFFNIDGVRRILGLGERMGPTLGTLLGSEEHAKELGRRVARCVDPASKEACIVS